MTWDLRHGHYEAALADVPAWDTTIIDAPYSERTHAGHADGTVWADSLTEEKWRRPCDGLLVPLRKRGQLTYGAWTSDDVHACVRWTAPRTRGWYVTITDEHLAPAWKRALAAQGRYVFGMLPWVAPGSRVRMSGDGPSQWTCWIIVARPRTRAFATWGTLPGAYVINTERGDARPGIVLGDKPLELMRALVRDYSRPSDVVCDPCAGGGTTLLAAVLEGRRALGAELTRTTYRAARRRLQEAA